MSFVPPVGWRLLVAQTYPSPPVRPPSSHVATCTWSASWLSRWLCSEKTAGFHWSPTGIPCRLVAMTTPCLSWAAIPAEDLLSAPRKLSPLWQQLELQHQRGNYPKVQKWSLLLRLKRFLVMFLKRDTRGPPFIYFRNTTYLFKMLNIENIFL